MELENADIAAIVMKLENPDIVADRGRAIESIGKMLAYPGLDQDEVTMLLLMLEKHILTIRRFEGLNPTLKEE